MAIAVGQRPANSERPPDIRGEDPSAAGCGPQGDHAEGFVAAGHDHQVNGAVHGAEDLVAERAGKGATLDAFLLRERRLHWDGIPVPGVKRRRPEPDGVQILPQRRRRERLYG